MPFRSDVGGNVVDWGTGKLAPYRESLWVTLVESIPRPVFSPKELAQLQGLKQFKSDLPLVLKLKARVGAIRNDFK